MHTKVNRAVRSAKAEISNFFLVTNESGYTGYSEVVNNISDVLSQKIGITVQAAIRGSVGGTMKGVNAALEKEAIENNPELAIMDVLPKSLKKNPIALMGLQAIISRIGSDPSSGSKTNGSAQTKFSL